jgi:hypothetical protein
MNIPTSKDPLVPIIHSINLSNAKTTGYIHRYGHDTYITFKYTDASIMSDIGDLYLTNGLVFTGKLRCKINRTQFIGINGKILDTSDLIGRNIEGIPIIRFLLSQDRKMNIRVDGYLVDNMDLKPIEILRLKAQELYTSSDITNFQSKLDIICQKDDIDLMHEVYEMPNACIPFLEMPQSVLR